jgi:hypothetical protein
MNPSLLSSLAAAAAALGLAPCAQAALVVDTGAPNGSAVGSLVFDGSDWVAAQVDFAHAATIEAIATHMLGGSAGETFDISLYDGGATPGAPLFTTTATYDADGWNGASGLAWTVAPGSYWIEFEVNGNDTLGTTPTSTGALLDTGVAHPVPTAATPDWGFTYDASAQSIGLQVSVVPEPAAALQVLAGMLLLSTLSLARRRR